MRGPLGPGSWRAARSAETQYHSHDHLRKHSCPRTYPQVRSQARACARMCVRARAATRLRRSVSGSTSGHVEDCAQWHCSCCPFRVRDAGRACVRASVQECKGVCARVCARVRVRTRSRRCTRCCVSTQHVPGRPREFNTPPPPNPHTCVSQPAACLSTARSELHTRSVRVRVPVWVRVCTPHFAVGNASMRDAVVKRAGPQPQATHDLERMCAQHNAAAECVPAE